MLNRRTRRQLARELGFHPNRSVNRLPSRRALSEMLFWRAPWNVTAHVYAHCRQLAREWAGYDLGRLRTAPAKRAMVATSGPCRDCVARLTVETRQRLGHGRLDIPATARS